MNLNPYFKVVKTYQIDTFNPESVMLPVKIKCLSDSVK